MPDAGEPVCVVLAAGRARRFGRDKTLALVDGEPMIARVLAVCAAFRTIVVASPNNVAMLGGAAYVVNDEPERGMTHSLRLADATIDRAHSLLVLLADMPFVEPHAVRAVADGLARGFDVAYPSDDERVGHPVGFSRTARTLIAALPDGDTIRQLRDDARLCAKRVFVRGDGCYRDVDRESDLAI